MEVTPPPPRPRFPLVIYRVEHEEDNEEELPQWKTERLPLGAFAATLRRVLLLLPVLVLITERRRLRSPTA